MASPLGLDAAPVKQTARSRTHATALQAKTQSIRLLCSGRSASGGLCARAQIRCEALWGVGPSRQASRDNGRRQQVRRPAHILGQDGSHGRACTHRHRRCVHSARAEPLAAASLASAVFWGQISSNTVLMAGVYGWAAAQIAKVPTHKVKKGVWDLSQLVAAGGMPSSHSALCMGVTTAVGIVHGVASTLFALALCFSVIVMYDAAGVRRHAGAQAEVLNTVVSELLHGHVVSEKKLKEVLGHTPLQVVMGALVGVGVGAWYASNFGPLVV